MKQKEKIFYDDDRCAKYVTDIKGWVSMDGLFFGDGDRAEHHARWASCTHLICDCGTEMDKGWTKCAACREKAAAERYQAMPQEEWDGSTPLFCDACDEYFFDSGALEDHAIECDTPRLIICTPQHLSQIEADHWEDVLPEDHGYHDLPEDVCTALDTLNAAIRLAPPISWYPGKKATTYTPNPPKATRNRIYMIDSEPTFHCPGCGYDHHVWVSVQNPSTGAQWTWNGSTEAPTFSPSINVFPNDDARRCHSFVRDGKIQYLGDCHHHLKGQTIDLPLLDAEGDPITPATTGEE